MAIALRRMALRRGSTTTASPADATYIVQTPDVRLPNAQALNGFGVGTILKVIAAGVLAAAVGGTDYVVPTGVAGGQTIIGGTGASESLTLLSTSNATKGNIDIGAGPLVRVDVPNNLVALIPPVYGSLSASGSLNLHSTTHATKGSIRVGGVGGIVWDQNLSRGAIGATAPAAGAMWGVDGSGLTTTAPILVLNGKAASGVEVQVAASGGVGSGFVVNDSGGVRRGAIGYAVATNDWITSAAVGDFVVSGPTTGSARILIKTASSGGVQVGSAGSTGNTVKGWASFTDTQMGIGVDLNYVFCDATTVQLRPNGSSVLTATSSLMTIQSGAKLAIDTSNSTTSVAVQVNGDANTGIGQIGGADTISLVAGGTEALRMDSTGKARFGLASIALGGGAAPTVGTIGGTGPTTAAQNKWGKLNFAGTDFFVPLWI